MYDALSLIEGDLPPEDLRRFYLVGTSCSAEDEQVTTLLDRAHREYLDLLVP